MPKRRRISKVDQVHERAMQMVSALKSAREKGTITPDKPMLGRTLAEQLNKYFHWDPPLSGDAGVRELANYARSIDQPVGIGAEGYGYYYTVTSPETMVAIASLKSRRLKIDAAIRGLERCARRQAQKEAFNAYNPNAIIGERDRDPARLSPEKIVKILEGEPDK